jgi:hypothetical protein
VAELVRLLLDAWVKRYVPSGRAPSPSQLRMVLEVERRLQSLESLERVQGCSATAVLTEGETASSRCGRFVGLIGEPAAAGVLAAAICSSAGGWWAGRFSPDLFGRGRERGRRRGGSSAMTAGLYPPPEAPPRMV